MTLLSSAAVVLVIALSSVLFASLGALLLNASQTSFPDAAERWLMCFATGVVAFELLVTLGALYPSTRLGVRTAVLTAAALALPRARETVDTIRSIFANLQRQPRTERILAVALAFVLSLQAFAAMAPLTGSDALHYHFVTPALTLQNGLRPEWFLQHSFLTGLSHQLILAGLALGSEKLAMGWIFLGGAATALATIYLASKWTKGWLPFAAGLLFLLTPVAFWQITTAGAPDIWMAFFLVVAVILIARCAESPSLPATIAAGLSAGAIAGAKYTGILLAALLFLAVAIEIRRWRSSALFLVSAAIAGCFPYLRNWLWTGDPVFPFLIRRLNPQSVNLYALNNLLEDTGTSHHLGLLPTLRFVSFAWIDSSNLGFWQILGPIVLCFLPLLLLAIRWTPLWRTVLLVWLGGALAIGLTSGMTRFSLPLLPLALAACMAGVSRLIVKNWSLPVFLAKSIILLYLCLGFVGLVAYDKNNFAAVAGLISREEYLRSRAPDYRRSEFVNEQLRARATEGRGMIFFSHTYYIDVPYLSGHPADSWAVDPSGLRTDAAWKQLFARNKVRWIVRGQEFPPAISEPLGRLERENILTRCGSGQVQDWVGNRIGGTIAAEPMTILCVAN